MTKINSIRLLLSKAEGYRSSLDNWRRILRRTCGGTFHSPPLALARNWFRKAGGVREDPAVLPRAVRPSRRLLRATSGDHVDQSRDAADRGIVEGFEIRRPNAARQTRRLLRFFARVECDPSTVLARPSAVLEMFSGVEDRPHTGLPDRERLQELLLISSYRQS
jgi:hypothetical protein